MNRSTRLLLLNSPQSRLSLPFSCRRLAAASPRRLLFRRNFHSSRDLLRRSSRLTAMEAASGSSLGSSDFVCVSGPEYFVEEEELHPVVPDWGTSSHPDPGLECSSVLVEASWGSGGGTERKRLLPEESDPVPDRGTSPHADPELDPNSVLVENSSEYGGGSEQKRVLPEELGKGVVFLECESSAESGSCDVYLVGTAHVSQESCREVQAIINCLKPEVVFLELCSRRVAILSPQNLKVPTVSEMIDMWKKKDANIFGILYSYFLAKVASKLEVIPGSEFRVAFEEARSYGAKVILGDRPVNITLRRTWGKMTLWHKAKFLFYILFQSINLPTPEDLNKLLKDLDDVDMVTLLIQEMSKEFPTVMETLLYERDLYMSSTLLKVAREHSSVVAVVGRGHLSGIKKNWEQSVEVKHLLEIPESSGISAMKILASLGVAVTGVAIISGIYLVGKRSQ